MVSPRHPPLMRRGDPASCPWSRIPKPPAAQSPGFHSSKPPLCTSLFLSAKPQLPFHGSLPSLALLVGGGWDGAEKRVLAKVAEYSREARGARPLVRPGSRDPSVDTLEARAAPLSQLSWRERRPGSAASAARGHPGNGGGGVTAHLQARGEGTGCTSAWEAPGGPPGTRISEKHQLMAGRLVGQTEVFL